MVSPAALAGMTTSFSKMRFLVAPLAGLSFLRNLTSPANSKGLLFLKVLAAITGTACNTSATTERSTPVSSAISFASKSNARRRRQPVERGDEGGKNAISLTEFQFSILKNAILLKQNCIF